MDDIVHDLEVVKTKVLDSVSNLITRSSVAMIAREAYFFVPSLEPMLCPQKMHSPWIISKVQNISFTLQEKINMLKTMGDRLKRLFSHDAILLLRHSFAIPKLLYILWTQLSFTKIEGI